MKHDHKMINDLARIGHEAATEHMASVIHEQDVTWEEAEPLHRECMIAAVKAILDELELRKQ